MICTRINDNCIKKVLGDLEKPLPFHDNNFDSITAIFILIMFNVLGIVNERNVRSKQTTISNNGAYIQLLLQNDIEKFIVEDS